MPTRAGSARVASLGDLDGAARGRGDLGRLRRRGACGPGGCRGGGRPAHARGARGHRGAGATAGQVGLATTVGPHQRLLGAHPGPDEQERGHDGRHRGRERPQREQREADQAHDEDQLGQGGEQQQATHATAGPHPATAGGGCGGAPRRVRLRRCRRRAGGRSGNRRCGIRAVGDALGDADRSGLGGHGTLDEHLRPGAAARVHGIRRGRRLGEVGAGQGVTTFEHAHRLTELLDRARGGDVVSPAHPVLHEIGSPDTEKDQEDQARRRLHATTVGARRRRTPDPRRCVAQVTAVTTVPEAAPSSPATPSP